MMAGHWWGGAVGKSHKLLHAGALVLNAGVFVGGSTRALAYSGILGRVRESPGPQILSDDGAYLWFYAALWAICACLAVYDGIRLRIGAGVIMLIPLLLWWAGSYLLAWQNSHYHSWDWMSAGIYIAACLCIGGLIVYVMGLRRQIRSYQESMATGRIRRVGDVANE